MENFIVKYWANMLSYNDIKALKLDQDWLTIWKLELNNHFGSYSNQDLNSVLDYVINNS